MKLVFPFVLALLPSTALAVPSTLQARCGGFYDSYPENNLYYSTINSKCNGSWTSIDLNQTIGNSNGKLIWASAAFFYSCGDIVKPGSQCTLQNDILGCYCKGWDGAIKWSNISLSTHLVYKSGRLFFN
ncbi:hypothetical protein GGR58DRAFT_464919 [Xylaria digitata]|nr:hypothetical protein GGR58DRAFT_464919 [Xylaria digitata]